MVLRMLFLINEEGFHLWTKQFKYEKNKYSFVFAYLLSILKVQRLIIIKLFL